MNDTEATTAGRSRQFAMRVLDAIRAAGRHTDADVAAVGGPSDSYMTTLRKAAAGEILLPEPRGHTQKRIEQAAGWAPGSTLHVWRGGQPTAGPRAPRDVQPAGGTYGSPATSDQELMQQLWKLLDERGAIDMFVWDALQKVEQRLAEVRAERNRLAHSPGPAGARTVEIVGDDATITVTEAELEAITERAVRMVLERVGARVDDEQVTDPAAGSGAFLAEAARRGGSAGRQLRRAQDEAGEESQDNGGEG